jgi:CHAT domain-containing protein/tetratricopeptide (TPR) repeat protein
LTSAPRVDVSELLATADADRPAYLRANGLSDGDGLNRVLDGAEELLHVDPATAAALFATVLDVAEPQHLFPVSARADYLHARVQADRGQLDAALQLISRARGNYERAGLLTQAWRTELGRMTVLDDLGRHHDAAEAGHALLAAIDAAPDPGSGPEVELRTWLRAAALENLGVTYGFLGQHQRALEAYAQAEATYTALDMPADAARPRANRGIELLELGQAEEALDALRSAAEAFAEDGDLLWSAKCLGHIAAALQQLGRLVEALRLLEPARATLDELGAEAEAARLRIITAGVYLTIGLYGEARSEARAAAARTAAAGMTHDTATAHLTTALAELGSTRYEQAAHELDQAAAEFEQVDDRQQLARVRLAQADVAAGRGRRADAAELANAAADAFRAGGWPVPLAWAILRRSDLAVDDGIVAALLAEADELAEELRLPRLREACDLRTARLRRRQGDLAEAEWLLRVIVNAVDTRGARLPDHTLRTAFHTDGQAVHDELVDLLVERGGRGDVGEAWRISDRSKARTLIDLITGTIGAGPEPGGAPAELQRQRVRLDTTYGALLLARDPVERAALRSRADELEQHISTLRLRTAVAEPTRDTSGAPSQVRRRTDRTIAYHVVGDDVIAFSAGSGTATAHRLTGAMPQVVDELDRLAAQWTRFRLGASFARRHADTLVDTTRTILHALDTLLLAPLRAAGLITADIEADGLIVVPHGRLHHVPFHALHDGAGYLIERHAVTVAPTGQWLPTQSDHRAGQVGDALILAVPDEHAPAVADEARALDAIVPHARTLIGADAISAVLTSATAAPSLLHIACHGLYRPGNPLFSALRLADRWVSAAEVLDLDLHGTLVTLSSCESGRPGTATVDPVGLAWAFLAAGASGAVVSQWVVHDDVAVDLMAAMYRGLVAGRHPAEALRSAQLATAASHPHPFFWAPFTFVASPRYDLTGVPPWREVIAPPLR